jgi:hypothetical protein
MIDRPGNARFFPYPGVNLLKGSQKIDSVSLAKNQTSPIHHRRHLMVEEFLQEIIHTRCIKVAQHIDETHLQFIKVMVTSKSVTDVWE